MKMRETLRGGKFSQIPQLSSSRKMDIQEKFEIVPKSSGGARRALLIGINYTGQQGQLSGCHNDVNNIKSFLMDVHGFQGQDITILMDDGNHKSPTHDNIIAAFRQLSLVSETEAGDCAFLHYSGKFILCCVFNVGMMPLERQTNDAPTFLCRTRRTPPGRRW